MKSRTQAELGPRQASGDYHNYRQEEELQAGTRDGGPATHGPAADVSRLFVRDRSSVVRFAFVQSRRLL
jgi:hypothetical protein